MTRAILFDISDVIVRIGHRAAIRTLEQRHGIRSGALYRAAHDHSYWKDFTLGKITERRYLMLVSQDLRKHSPIVIDTNELSRSLVDGSSTDRGVLAYARQLSKTYRLGVVSNLSKEWYRRLARQHRFTKLFKVIAISGIVHVRKPDARLFRYALKHLKVEPQECVYVDDRPEKARGAKKLGMRVVVFRNVRQLRKDMRRLLAET